MLISGLYKDTQLLLCLFLSKPYEHRSWTIYNNAQTFYLVVPCQGPGTIPILINSLLHILERIRNFVMNLGTKVD